MCCESRYCVAVTNVTALTDPYVAATAAAGLGLIYDTLMTPAAEEMGRAIMSTPLKPPRVPVVSNITALPLTSVNEIRRELVGQLTAGVRWEDSVRMMAAAGVDLFIEIGAGNVLTGLVKRIVKDVGTLSVSDPAGIELMRTLV